ncbi:MAG: helix-turn-helix transcriptional regulator [Pseudomonadota bacterium]
MAFDYSQLTPEMIKAARALLGWKQDDLVAASGVSKTTLQVLESGGTVADRTRRDVFLAFERVGMEFYNHDEPGLRLRKQSSD